jgi:hypothetical protein
MKVEHYLGSPAHYRAFARFLIEVADAGPGGELVAAPEAVSDVVTPPVPVAPHDIPAATPATEAPAPKRRGRPTKAEAPVEAAPVVAPAAALVAAEPTIEEPAAPPPAATIDDVRKAMGEYVKVYGMAAAQEDGPKLLRQLFGEAVAKISSIPADGYGLAVEEINAMIAANPHGRTKVA